VIRARTRMIVLGGLSGRNVDATTVAGDGITCQGCHRSVRCCIGEYYPRTNLAGSELNQPARVPVILRIADRATQYQSALA